jgi:hypothetical protein
MMQDVTARDMDMFHNCERRKRVMVASNELDDRDGICQDENELFLILNF